ncbi:MAG: right-handed parallel beta-helix repeat-containing protein [Kiritimatiellae bacterium]|nr:right-handed parallel beta-helix repeat-containing protein [Kiritimatiellia bacterium]
MRCKTNMMLAAAMLLTGWVVSPALSGPAPAVGKVASFETDADNPFVLRNNIAGTRVTEHATDGQYSLRVVAKGSDKPSWPALWLYPKAEPNWSARQLLVMDIFIETLESVEFGAQLCLEGRKENLTLSMGRLTPGWNKNLTLCLQDFEADLSRVADLALYVARPRKDVVYTIDNVRWEIPPLLAASNGWLNVRDFGASGSEFETVATAAAGSNQITVAEAGDFREGQQVSVSKCNIRYLSPTRYGPGEPYATSRRLGDALEMRGYDGEGGSWLAYVVEIDGADPLTFRWKGDIAKPWAASKVPVTCDWQPLSGGTEIRFKNKEWKPGELVTFSARDQLIATIEKIEGRVLTLSETANRTATNAVLRHTDRVAVQKAIDLARRRKCNVFFPAGHYRIPGGLRVVKPDAIRLEGANAETTVLDISDGSGACLSLSGGTEVTIRNFTMVGHTGLAEAPKSFTTSSGYGYWPNSLKGCSAVVMSGTERVLIENVHARRMASECFYAQGPVREGQKEPAQYQKALTYLRCSVTDCAANAFNNNDRGENTSILYCRVDGAGWHAAEMPARFLRVIGSYFRNTGAITVGDMSHRFEDLNELGCGQAMVCDNVFEGIGRSGGVYVGHGSSQVVISGNLFINFNGSAITVSSQTVRPSLPWFSPTAPLSWGSYPSRSVVIRGNIIDMTYPGTNADARVRTGIWVNASEVTVADNQVYVRGACDPRVTGISLSEPALHVTIHDNLIRNCGAGLVTGRTGSRVTQVIDSTTFLDASLPLEWRYSHQYQGWNIVWFSRNQTNGTSVIDSYDPATLRFKLTAPRDMKVGDTFEVFPPGSANWLIHDNTITGCQRPVVLNSYGSDTSILKGNLISRGEATGATQAIHVVRGQFKLIDNQINGF